MLRILSGDANSGKYAKIAQAYDKYILNTYEAMKSRQESGNNIDAYFLSIINLRREYENLLKTEKLKENISKIHFNINFLEILEQLLMKSDDVKTMKLLCKEYSDKLKKDTESIRKEEEIIDTMLEKEKIKARIIQKKTMLLELTKTNLKDSHNLDTNLIETLEHNDDQTLEFTKAVCVRSLDDKKLRDELSNSIPNNNNNPNINTTLESNSVSNSVSNNNDNPNINTTLESIGCIEFTGHTH